MAENVRETGPPEVPKPTEQSSRSESSAQPDESQQSARRDARDAAPSEHAKATIGREPDGLRPTPEFRRGPTADENAERLSPAANNAAPRGSAVDGHSQTATDAGDITRAGDGSGPWFDEGTNHREAARSSR